MDYIVSERQLKTILDESKEPSFPLVIKLFKMLNEVKKTKRKRADILEAIEQYLPYVNIPSNFALYILELFLLNYREDGDYTNLTKENFVDPRKAPGKWTPNTKSKYYTIAQMPFKGSNLEGYWTKDHKGNPYYVVMSYKWYPVYIFKDDKWYEVTARYSSSTSRQMENANPVEWNEYLDHDVYLLTPEEVKLLNSGASHEEVMRHKIKKLKEFEPELTKRKKTAKTHSWYGGEDEVEFPNANIKFKIKSVDVDDDKATVTIDILDVLRRDDGKEVKTPENYLEGGMQGMNKERAEDKVKVKVMGILRNYMATRFRYNGEDPPIQNIFFKFNHVKK